MVNKKKKVLNKTARISYLIFLLASIIFIFLLNIIILMKLNLLLIEDGVVLWKKIYMTN